MSFGLLLSGLCSSIFVKIVSVVLPAITVPQEMALGAHKTLYNMDLTSIYISGMRNQLTCI